VSANEEASSRRELKRLETRRSISNAALGLTLARGGLETVRPEEIAKAAGVSPRTFHNYFPSREAALGALAGDRAKRIALKLGDRPADEPFATALTEVVAAEYTDGEEPEKESVHKLHSIMAEGCVNVEALRAVMSEEGARPHVLHAMTRLEAELIPVIAKRFGLDPDRDMFPWIVAAAVNGAIRVATEYWLRDDVDAPYTALLREAVATAAALAEQAPPPPPGPVPA